MKVWIFITISWNIKLYHLWVEIVIGLARKIDQNQESLPHVNAIFARRLYRDDFWGLMGKRLMFPIFSRCFHEHLYILDFCSCEKGILVVSSTIAGLTKKSVIPFKAWDTLWHLCFIFYALKYRLNIGKSLNGYITKNNQVPDNTTERQYQPEILNHFDPSLPW